MSGYKSTAGLPKQGTDPYKLGPGAVAAPKKGQMVSKKGNSKGGGGEPATANHRSQTVTNAGASFRVVVKRGGYDQTTANLQANGRLMPSVMGSKNNFSGGAATR